MTLGRSLLGPCSLDRQGKRRKQELGVSNEVWTPHGGQSSLALYPNGLVSFCPVLASFQVGGTGVRKENHSYLVLRAGQGRRAELQEKSRWPARVS
jgi:hypothetical protein